MRMPPTPRFRPVMHPLARPDQSVTGEHWRVTVLTPRLLRLEWSDAGVFEDRATQVVWHRDLPPARFTVTPLGEGIRLETDALRLDYDGRPFSSAGLTVRQHSTQGHHTVWHYGDPEPALRPTRGNMGGTARTLDEVDGALELGTGVVSALGWATLDDAASLALDEDGWPTPRLGDADLYFFGHGHDGAGAVRDLYAITGPQPLLPRWAFGNWWSRYHPYSASEYTALMDRFASEGMPFSVAVIDMDWHWVELADGHGSGWTGFSWNTDLFPASDAFLTGLHERGLKVSLNLHPADGVRSFEDAYPALARRLGRDPESQEVIEFAVADPAFMAAYFDTVLHPLEDAGVDFWWLDWQQGTSSALPGLDPLWLLNHAHYLDSAREGKRPITFSRYAGPGSHRYPVGFSGDTVTSWDSLDFQPYFTATAANIGYGWWSHDIGGHMFGTRDDEMVARWFQLGTFSPINRLHSTASPFMGKEPWMFGIEARTVMTEALRLRHRLVPYLYTMNEVAHRTGTPLVRPLYHADPREETVFSSLNTFLFGSELLVAPATTPRDRRTLRTATTAWLPEGTWVDFFDGTPYSGGRFVTLHRTLEQYPVLAKAGAIVPLVNGEDLNVANPAALTIRVFAGADGAFTLYEDDDAAEPVAARTTLTWDQASGTFVIAPVQGDASVVPHPRTWTLEVVGIARAEVDSYGSTYDAASGTLRVELGAVEPSLGASVRLTAPPTRFVPDADARLFALITQLQVGYPDKHALWAFLSQNPDPARRVAGLAALPIAEDIKPVIAEVLLARL